MQQNQVELDYLEMVEIAQAADLMGKTIKALLREGAAGQRLLYAAVAPEEAVLGAIPSHPAPLHARRKPGGTIFVALYPTYCVDFALRGYAEIKHWPAAAEDQGMFAWHSWSMKEPQKLNLDMVFVHEADVMQRGAATAVSDSERDKLLRQIAALALVAAGSSKRYVRGDKPNVSQIAEAAVEMVEALPDSDKRGLRSTSLRDSIRDGFTLLKR